MEKKSDSEMSKKNVYRNDKKHKEYLLALHRYRSVTTLIACTITLVVCLFAIGQDLVNYTQRGWQISDLFRYFTIQSNLITAAASGFIIPFAINGIRKRYFTYPKWLAMLHYSGTVCTTFVFVFVILFMGPYNREFAYGGANFYLHVICPITIIVSYLFVESDYSYTPKDYLICSLPFVLYSILYIYNVLILTESNGGWDDFYKFNTFVPFYVSLPLVLILSSLIGLLLRRLSLRLNKYRKKEMLRVWDEDVDPLEIKIDIYGLGRYNGLSQTSDNDLIIPYGLLQYLAEKYSIDTNQMIRIFTKGLLDGMKEKQDISDT